MSITRERLNEIALELGEHFGSFEYGDAQGEVTKAFAFKLIKAVEAEMEVVGYRHATAKGCYANEAWVYGADAKPLIALPLIEGDGK